MYRLYYKCIFGNIFTKKRTCFNSLNEMIEQVCKWNSLKSNYIYAPINWEAIYVSPLEDEIFPRTMEYTDGPT